MAVTASRAGRNGPAKLQAVWNLAAFRVQHGLAEDGKPGLDVLAPDPVQVQKHVLAGFGRELFDEQPLAFGERFPGDMPLWAAGLVGGQALEVVRPLKPALLVPVQMVTGQPRVIGRP